MSGQSTGELKASRGSNLMTQPCYTVILGEEAWAWSKSKYDKRKSSKIVVKSYSISRIAMKVIVGNGDGEG